LEIGLDSAVLVFLAMSTSRADAVVIWALATVFVQMLVPRHKTLATRLFNTGLCMIAGTVAILAMWAVAPMGRTGPMEILAFLIGCAVYFTVDFVLTGASIALTHSTSMRAILLSSTVPLTLVGFLGVNALGWLAGITLRSAPYGLPLVTVPFVAVILAMRAYARMNRERGRLELLFETSLASQAAVTADDVQDVLLARASRLLACKRVTLRDAAPDERAGEIGVRIHQGDDSSAGPLWLVADSRIDGQPYDDTDRDSLQTLATVGAESLRRAGLTATMSRMARSDALTGLDNRSVLRERLEMAIVRNDHTVTVGVIYIDLDRFKSVNDTLGHDAGDSLLLQVAERLRGCVRASDTVARMGGDEFAILVRSVGGEKAVAATAHRVLAAIAEPIVLFSKPVSVGASVGYAIRRGDEDAADMLQRADMAMYSVKETGKQSVAAFTPDMVSRRTARAVLHRELAVAVANGELRVHLQPVVSLETGVIDGVEALMRWQHPTRGLLGPVDFIDIAEETGLIEELGLWVLRQSWEDAERLGQALGRPVSLAVNVAARQLEGDTLVRAVSGLPAGGTYPTLVLEVTERDLVDVESTATLLDLQALGVNIAVDDFGTGYSSFAYLRTLPVDIVKLDRQFVVDAADDGRATGVIRAVTAMAQALGLVTIAEGVETQEQADLVRSAGCQLGQGYLFARPMPVDNLIASLTAAAV
jgi:diguanylate cyclase (GGDEF)-like protein